MKSCRN